MPNFAQRLLGRIPGLRPPRTPTNYQEMLSTQLDYVQQEQIGTDYRLLGSYRFDTYRQLIRDVSALNRCINITMDFQRNATWNFEEAMQAGEPHPQAEEAKAIVEQSFRRTSRTAFTQIVVNCAIARFYGFSIQEWSVREDTLDTGETRLMLDRVNLVNHRRVHDVPVIEPDENRPDYGQLIGFGYRPANFASTLTFLPRDKVVYTVHRNTENRVWGQGLLDGVASDCFRLQRFTQMQETGLKFAFWNLLTISYPSTKMYADAEALTGTYASSGEDDPYHDLDGRPNSVVAHRRNRDSIEKFKARLRSHNNQDAKLMIMAKDSAVYEGRDAQGGDRITSAEQWKIDILNGDSPQQAQISLDKRDIEYGILALFGLESTNLGMNTSSSLALARDKSSNFRQLIDSILDTTAESLRRDIGMRLCELNGLDPAAAPRMVPEVTTDVDLDKISNLVRAVTAAPGFTFDPRDPMWNEIRSIAGFSGMPDEVVESILTQPPANPTPEEDTDGIS